MKSKRLFAGILISSMLLSMGTGCSKKSADSPSVETIEQKASGNAIYELVSAKSAKEKSSDEDLQKAYSEFALGMIRRGAAGAGNDNFMVSTDSALFALEMTAAGADGETLDQMLGTLMPGVDKEDALLFAVDRMAQIKSDQLQIANSIWINDKSKGAFYDGYLKYVEKNFDAKIGAIPFNDSGVDKINSWVSDKTDGMIQNLIKVLEEEDKMVLVNALSFEAKWKKPFEAEDVKEGTFYRGDGQRETCNFLCGDGGVGYLYNDKATGFYKVYEGEKYAFMVILPGAPKDDFLVIDSLLDEPSTSYEDDEDEYLNVDINVFVAGMTAEDYRSFWGSRGNGDHVEFKFPEFTSEYETSLREILLDMGMTNAFSDETANFGNMSNLTGLCIDDVIHMTRIEVNAEGTKAAASTAVVMEHNGVIQNRKVICDRPFAYAIVDMETGLPIFFGTVEHVN
ncbi:MAG: serpin family protein [Clostridiales bacterium]|nr:serpin family protein [Clostridiales bacterium]